MYCWDRRQSDRDYGVGEIVGMFTDINVIQELRKKLHNIPEPSMQEQETKQMLMDFLRSNTNLAIIDRGVWFYAKYEGNHNGDAIPATINDAVCVEKIKAAAKELGLNVIIPDEPFRWSEDFGYYLQKTKGAFFGIGSGENHPGLHTAEYEFQDAIMETAIDLYDKILMRE